jgi:NADH:ubiquinone oxidoreductase subunit 3 (subunit A)
VLFVVVDIALMLLFDWRGIVQRLKIIVHILVITVNTPRLLPTLLVYVILGY